MKHDGGPAFPDPARSLHSLRNPLSEPAGMSLRDWFAGMALNGYLSNGPIIDIEKLSKEERELSIGELITKRSYFLADAMLKEREK